MAGRTPANAICASIFGSVEAFMACNTVLPVRFGTVFPGLAELQAHLARGHDVYASDLRRLRGQIEAERQSRQPGGTGTVLRRR